MRTTITIDDELLGQVKVLAARSHRSIGSVMEDALRRFLAEQQASRAGDFTLPRHAYDEPGLRPGVDLLDHERLAELLGDDELS